MPCSVAEESSLGMLCHWASGSSSSPTKIAWPSRWRLYDPSEHLVLLTQHHICSCCAIS